MELDPSRFSAHQHLGRLYLLQNRSTEALGALRRAADLGELEQDLTLSLVRLELLADNESAAERQLQSLVDRFESVKALLLLARLHSDRSDPAGALQRLEQAVGLAPNSEAVLAAYAHASMEGGTPVPAILALDSLTRMHPLEARYFYLSGIARLQARDIGGAIDALRIARELEPQRVSTLIALGLALNTQKSHEEAAALLQFALRLEPQNVDALAGLAEAREGESNLEAAERFSLRALSAGPEHPLANMTLGMIRMKQGRYEEARNSFETALALDPGSPKALYQLSLAYARLGDREESRRHLELYRQALDAYEDGLRALDAQSGKTSGGMRGTGVRQ